MRELDGYVRYAVYAEPAPGAVLARLGPTWLGWDAEAGAPIDRASFDGVPAHVLGLNQTPARYGFHATLKAPFPLVDRPDAPAALDAALRAFAAARAPIRAPALQLTGAHGFVSLRLSAPCPAIDALAADCVRTFDRFRAPLTDADRTRRGADRLSPELRDNLERWGYPYVFNAFDLHFTLTGHTDDPEAAIAALRPHFAPALRAPFTLSSISLFGDPGAAPLRRLRRYRLSG